MKKFLSLGLIAAMFLVACGPDEAEPKKGEGSSVTVSDKQRSVLWYYTATWCPPCGQYGSPTFKDIIKNNDKNDLVALDFHATRSALSIIHNNEGDDGAVYNAILGDMGPSLRSPGTIPTFTLNNVYEGGSSVAESAINSKIETYNDGTAKVGVEATASLSGNTFTVNTKAKFFEEAEGEYYFSVIAMEETIIATQSVGSTTIPNFEHNNIVRASLIGGDMKNQKSFDEIATGTVEANKVVEKSYTFEFSETNAPEGFTPWALDKENTTVVVIVWKKNGELYDTVNAVQVEL